MQTRSTRTWRATAIVALLVSATNPYVQAARPGRHARPEEVEERLPASITRQLLNLRTQTPGVEPPPDFGERIPAPPPPPPPEAAEEETNDEYISDTPPEEETNDEYSSDTPPESAPGAPAPGDDETGPVLDTSIQVLRGVRADVDTAGVVRITWTPLSATDTYTVFRFHAAGDAVDDVDVAVPSFQTAEGAAGDAYIVEVLSADGAVVARSHARVPGAPYAAFLPLGTPLADTAADSGSSRRLQLIPGLIVPIVVRIAARAVTPVVSRTLTRVAGALRQRYSGGGDPVQGQLQLGRDLLDIVTAVGNVVDAFSENPLDGPLREVQERMDLLEADGFTRREIGDRMVELTRVRLLPALRCRMALIAVRWP